MPEYSPAFVLLPSSLKERQEAQRSPPIFDWFLNLRHSDIMHNRITVPLKLPRHKRTGKMAHAEYIANTIRKDIQNYRIKSFDNFGIEVRIHPMPSAFEVYDIKGKWIGFNKYIFEAYGAESKEMFVTVDHKWNVKIHYLGRWRSISAYLKHVKPHNAWAESTSKVDTMHMRWRQQADWWKENGKVFPLMKLPGEVREMIYEHVWGPLIEPYPMHKARNLTKIGKLSRKLRMPNANLRLTRRLVEEEATNILYMRARFRVEHYGVWKSLTMNVEQRSRIRHLELALSHDEFVNLFSTEHVRRDRKAKTEVVGFGYPALALRSMKLSSLRIIVAPPSLTTQSGTFDGACQRVAVAMIMEAAWPIIRGHPLQLGGYVKHGQKKIYEARDVLERKKIQEWQKKRAAWGMPQGSLEEYDEELDEDIGGVSLSGSRPETAPEQMPAPEYDLTCYCDPACEEETWTP